MKIISAADYGYRKVVRVLVNPDDPEAIHADGSPHTGDPTTDRDIARVAAFRTEFGREPTSWEWCEDCRYNWDVREFTFTGTELVVATNKWGNVAQEDQVSVESRARTWNEFYNEVEERLGEGIDRIGAPVAPAPATAPEAEPDFELILSGDPFMDGTLAKQRFLVLRRGVRAGDFVAEGENTDDFAANRGHQYVLAQTAALARESALVEAQVITGS